MLKKSADYSFVRVETDSVTSSYDPRTTQGVDVQTMVSVSIFSSGAKFSSKSLILGGVC